MTGTKKSIEKVMKRARGKITTEDVHRAKQALTATEGNQVLAVLYMVYVENMNLPEAAAAVLSAVKTSKRRW